MQPVHEGNRVVQTNKCTSTFENMYTQTDLDLSTRFPLFCVPVTFNLLRHINANFENNTLN